MATVRLELGEDNNGSFVLYEGEEIIGEMQVGFTGYKELTVYHTEVKPEYEGKGYSKQLLSFMVNYVCSREMKVVALCSYVQAQFKRHEDLYGDILINNTKEFNTSL
ncbi:MAG: N-acetyltransferase [Sporocytophaga sp.]|uniref:GNAT family N-acetyltransferase n=1 Tax=Sporocytophaga sp. TaxID=2231183 RepID=UPI001B12720C|nr:GNAT family N-acetyltransferase [Sporocytophaga sp.]MBO9701880.1 N-acetyltransferase [Sporocytophaga sp.]